MSNLDSVWEKVNAQAIVGNVTEIFYNLKKELHTAWESEDWQIKVLMIQVVTVAILLVLIALAWKIHGPSIGKLLTTEARSVNPHHWDTKMAFWTVLIKDMSKGSGYAYISWDNLFSRLARHGRSPLGLQLVFDEMVTGGELVSTAEYTRDIQANESWVGWGLNWCVKKPVSWMADKVLSPIKTRPGRDMKNGQYVLLSALQDKCDRTLAKFYALSWQADHSGFFQGLNIISYTSLQEVTNDFVKDEESLDLILATLRKNRVVEVSILGQNGKNGTHSEVTGSAVSGEKYVKFAKKNEKRVTPFSEVDIGIVHLQQTKIHLEQIIDKTYKEIAQCTDKAREYVKNQQKTMAKNALRRRKRLEMGVEKRERALNNVEQLLESIHQCKTDKMIMDTYRVGVAAYRDLTATSGLSEDAVQDTMDELSNVMDTHADITNALSATVTTDSDEEMTGLDAELAALLEDTSEESDMAGILHKLDSLNIENGPLNLPAVPEGSPRRAKIIDSGVGKASAVMS